MMLSSTQETWLPQIQHPIFKLLAFSYHHFLNASADLNDLFVTAETKDFPTFKDLLHLFL
jgi:hypothetical protein